MGEDRTPPVRRTTVAEAAEILGISAEAVRGRIRRGTLPVEREGGTVYVLIDQAAQQSYARTTADQSRTTADQPTDRTEVLERLIARLEHDLEEANERDKENRRIIAMLTSRIPAIEAPESPEPRPGTDTPTDAGGEAQEGPGRPDSEAPRQVPWWRRMFGG